MTRLDHIVVSVISQLLGVGQVWFFAMLFNPNIDSGTVMVLGLIYGGLQASFAVQDYERRHG